MPFIDTSEYYMRKPADLIRALSQGVSAMVSVWYQSIGLFNRQLLNGLNASIARLDDLLEDGKLLQNGYSPLSDIETRDVMARALYATLIPMA
jgi:hypothetical protein